MYSDDEPWDSPAEDQRKMMELLSQETRHSIIMAILGHPHHLASRTELGEMVSKSSGAINDAIECLQDEEIIDVYETQNPENPNKRDFPTEFWSLTRRGVRILHEYNYLRLVPIQRALFDSSVKDDVIRRHLKADRPSLPEDIRKSLEFDEELSSTVDDKGRSIFPNDFDDELDAVEKKDQFEPKIAIIGCGGAGNNVVNRLNNIGIEETKTIALDTDKQHLNMIEADTKILVGKSITQGLGTGGDPSMGERGTEMAQETIKEVLGDADLVFVTAGMGGGTGTGAAPILSNIAKEQGAIVVGMVSIPFNVERARTVKAEEGLERLRNTADSIIVLDNNRLLDYVPNLPIGKAFSVMDQIIAETVKEISETITQPSLINIDYEDMSRIMKHGGAAVMLVGETQDKDKPQEAINDAMNHPLLDVDYRGASGGLVHITGGPDLTLNEAEEIANNITKRLGASAHVIWGARIQDEYEGKIRVMAIMTGVQSAQILGSTTEKQADKSRASIELGGAGFDADDNVVPNAALWGFEDKNENSDAGFKTYEKGSGSIVWESSDNN